MEVRKGGTTAIAPRLATENTFFFHLPKKQKP
jgi:hypothetical protein